MSLDGVGFDRQKEDPMRRPTAIIITVVAFLFYGVPSFLFCFFSAQLAIGSTDPYFREGFEAGSDGLSPDIILPIALGLFCVFGYLIFVPILVGFLSYLASKKKDNPENQGIQNITQT